jgi:hypothetical protein
MTDISSPSVPASQNSTGEPATPPSGPHVASSRYRGATEGHNRTRPRRVRDSARRTLRQRSRRRALLLRRARRCAGQHGAGSYGRVVPFPDLIVPELRQPPRRARPVRDSRLRAS